MGEITAMPRLLRFTSTPMAGYGAGRVASSSREVPVLVAHSGKARTTVATSWIVRVRCAYWL